MQSPLTKSCFLYQPLITPRSIPCKSCSVVAIPLGNKLTGTNDPVYGSPNQWHELLPKLWEEQFYLQPFRRQRLGNKWGKHAIVSRVTAEALTDSALRKSSFPCPVKALDKISILPRSNRGRKRGTDLLGSGEKRTRGILAVSSALTGHQESKGDDHAGSTISLEVL